MTDFLSVRKAKEFLASRIVTEAKLQNVPLSEIERKMLYFSETEWATLDMLEVNAEFERDCDEDKYKRKIAWLARSIETHLKDGDEEESDKWYAAIEKLSEGDHYLLVLLNASPSSAIGSARPPGDLLKLWLTAFGIALGGLTLLALGNWLFGARFWVVMDRLSDRIPFYGVILLGILIWALRSKIRAAILALWLGK